MDKNAANKNRCFYYSINLRKVELQNRHAYATAASKLFVQNKLLATAKNRNAHFKYFSIS